jgi:hypothetical protein
MTDLFDAPTPGNYDASKNYLEELVGDGKKFKTVDDLARGKAESDAFINRLLEEQKQLRDDFNQVRAQLNQRTKLDEFLDKVNKPDSDTSGSDNNQNSNSGGANQAAFDPSKIDEIVDKRLSDKERERQAQSNANFVKEELQKAYGADYVTKLAEVAEDLGLSRERVNQLAATEPKALLRLVGVGQAQNTPQARPDVFSPPKSSGTFVPRVQNTEKNYAFYEDMRKKDPTRYWSPDVQVEIHKRAMELGEAFYS